MTTLRKSDDYTPEQVDDQNITDSQDVIRHVSTVHTPLIKDHIKSDIVYAQLNEKNKEFIIEMTNDAYYADALIRNIAETKRYQWIQDHWELKPLKKETQTKIHKLANQCFAAYMTKPFMIAITNRNTPDNSILKWVLHTPEEDDQETIKDDMLNKMKNALQPK